MFMIIKELELSNEQREKFRKIMDESKYFKSAMQQTPQVRPKLSNYLTEKSFYKEKFAKDVLEFETAKIQGRTAHKLDNLEKVFNILTPEQRKKGIIKLY